MTRTETGKEGTTGMSGTGNTDKDYVVLDEGSVMRLIDRTTALLMWNDKHCTEDIYMIFDNSGKYLCETESDFYTHNQLFALYCGDIWDIAEDFNRKEENNGLYEETAQ